MKNSDQPAFPADSQTQTDGGLTKREYFAAMAMQGILSNRELQIAMYKDFGQDTTNTFYPKGLTYDDVIAFESKRHADLLLKQLETQQP